jgi:hypothetical protein
MLTMTVTMLNRTAKMNTAVPICRHIPWTCEAVRTQRGSVALWTCVLEELFSNLSREACSRDWGLPSWFSLFTQGASL